MKLSDKSVLSFYQPLADVNARHKVRLVQHTKTNKIFVEKKLAQYNLSVFQDLREHPVPDTPRIYELVEENGILTVIEEYLPGRTLQDYLDEWEAGKQESDEQGSGEQETLSESEAVSLVLALSRIVRQLHHRNPPIIHRDIKPANIILTQDYVIKESAAKDSTSRESVSKDSASIDSAWTDSVLKGSALKGSALMEPVLGKSASEDYALKDHALKDHALKLLDFSASKYVSEDKGQDTVLLGTRGYAAPEQYGFGKSCLQTDIYAIGVLLNVLLTGKLPAEQLADGRLSAVITKCTQLNPSDRFSDIDELIAVLEKPNSWTVLSGEETISKEEAEPVYGQSGKNTDTEPEQDIRDQTDQSFRRFLPPGFRSGSPVNMAIAIAGYLYLFLAGIKLTFPYIAVIFFTADYLNVQSYLPVTRSKNRAIRAIGIVFYDLIILFLLVALSQLL
ncbi:MAG: protein kinase [Lachnospiraceae bacterium]|nr:protein kinase [Lachnospiraceae bacterium]